MRLATVKREEQLALSRLLVVAPAQWTTAEEGRNQSLISSVRRARTAPAVSGCVLSPSEGFIEEEDDKGD